MSKKYTPELRKMLRNATAAAVALSMMMTGAYEAESRTLTSGWKTLAVEAFHKHHTHEALTQYGKFAYRDVETELPYWKLSKAARIPQPQFAEPLGPDFVPRRKRSRKLTWNTADMAAWMRGDRTTPPPTLTVVQAHNRKMKWKEYRDAHMPAAIIHAAAEEAVLAKPQAL